MSRPGRRTYAVTLGLVAWGCGSGDGPKGAGTAGDPAAQRDAEVLGREVFELVDRALDYRGSHQGRPPASLYQLGVDSLTPTTVRRLTTASGEPLVAVAYRRPQGHVITSCQGDSRILEEAALNEGRFTVRCAASSGAEWPMRVGRPPAAD